MAGFGSLAPDDDSSALDDPQYSYGLPPLARPPNVDWSRFNQPFGEIKPPDEGKVIAQGRDPRLRFTEADVNKAIGLGTSFSGGGLATEVPKPAVGARQAFQSWADALAGGKSDVGQAGQQATGTAPAVAGPERVPDIVPGGDGGRDARVGQAQAQAKAAGGQYAPLPGLPKEALQVGDSLYVPGPIGKIKDVAEGYMRDKIKPSYHQPPEQYYPLDPEHSARIAQAYEDMPHAPDDPAVKASYDAMIKETRDQYRAIRANHPELQFVPNKPGEDPYAATPRLAARDVVENNRLHFFPTEQGFGTDVPAAPPTKPLAIKDAVPAPPPEPGMVRLFRGGGAQGGSNWVTTSQKYAEGYTTPGLAYSPKAGSYLKYVDVPATDPRVQMPPGQKTHSFEAPDEIAGQLKPFYQPKQAAGSQAGIDMSTHPMMQPSGETLNGKPLLNNDLFRIVHDYFGHLKEGYGFRAAGEDNAWRSHAAMYSDLARPAMTTETRGQNSWVNYGPHGDANRSASAADTTYAPQKVGLMPEWTMRDRGSRAPLLTYQGSPSGHSMIDMSKIGTGEGSAVRGQGMYSAEAESIARRYRYMTATMQDPVLKKYKLGQFEGANMGRDLADTLGDHEPVVSDLQDHIENLRAKQAEGDTSMQTSNQINSSQNMIRYLRDPKRAQGHLYQLAIDRPEEQFLHWDKPLSEQSDYVQGVMRPILQQLTPKIQSARQQLLAKAQAQMARAPPGIIQQKLEKDIARYSQPVSFENVPGEKLYPHAAHVALGRAPKDPDEAGAVATPYLRAKGIAGIKYLAGKNFGVPPGAEGTHNYVTFDPPRILRRYAVPGLVGAGLGASMMSRGQDGS